LLADALRRAAHAAESIGIVAVLVQAEWLEFPAGGRP
jgi:hypothetical protein